jgi:hypothetical protein
MMSRENRKRKRKQKDNRESDAADERETSVSQELTVKRDKSGPYKYEYFADKKTVHFPFPAGGPMMVAGPTGCGKTNWIFKLLCSRLNFSEPVHGIMYCYGVYQPMYTEMKRIIPNLEFHKGLPNTKTVKNFADGDFKLIILDDLMEKVIDNLDAQQLFTKYCHHLHFTTIFVTQNIFAPGRCSRTIALNTLILVLFQNHRDRSQIWTVARQISPKAPTAFVNIFEKVTSKPYGYLIIDCTPQCNQKFRWRSDIFMNEHEEGTCFVTPEEIPLSMSCSCK